MKVKFGEMVKDVKSNVDRANNPYKFYVAGDHMDSEDFRIHRRGSFATDDVGPAFVRIFHPGQVLYGSRRTYLKKVCVADFDGICANTTFVLETKDEGVLTQRLLPFLMLSDGFTDWSIKHSKGSTNPYILFSDLANYEFDLPPIERQRELADLLWAANDLKEAYKKAISATDEMLKAKFREMFGGCGGRREECGDRDEKTWNIATLKEIATDFRNGLSPSHQGNIHSKSLTLTAITQGFFDQTQWKDATFDFAIPQNKIVNDTDFYVSRGNGNKKLVGVGVFSREDHEDLVFPDTVIAFKPRMDVMTLQFLFYYWQTETIRSQIETIAKTSNGIYKISQNGLKNIKLLIPPLALQQEFVAIAEAAEETKAALKRSLGDLEQVMKGLINA